MNYDDIRSVLENRLQTVTGLPPLQAENTRFTTTGTPWCRSTLLPAEPTAATLGPNGRDQHRGLWQLDLFFPQDRGTAASSALAKLVMDAFPRGPIVGPTQRVDVSMCWQQPAYQAEKWYVVPVLVRWSSFSTS